MKLRKLTLGLVLVSTMSFTIVSCGPKDDEVKTKVTTTINKPNIMVDVTKGVATLSGEVVSEQEKTDLENQVKAIEGVKSVVNNITVPPPPKVDPDAENNSKIAAALKDFPKVQGTVANGVVTLTGEATKDENKKVMQAVSGLNIGKIENKITVK